MKSRKFEDYYFGFVLDESNLRRFIDLSIERLKLISDSEAPLSEDSPEEKEIEVSISVTHKNGTIHAHENINSIFSEKNTDEYEIVGLSASIAHKHGENAIQFQFVDLDHRGRIARLGVLRDAYYSSISTSVSSNDRDWAFLTSSMIEDRVLHSKRKKVPYVLLNHNNMMGLLFVGFIFGLLLLMPPVSNQDENKESQMDNYILTELKKIDQSKDKISSLESLILYEEIKQQDAINNREKFIFARENNKAMVILLVTTFIPLLLCYIYNLMIKNLHPFYVFNLGDYEKIYQRTEDLRKIVIQILIGISVSLFAGFVILYF